MSYERAQLRAEGAPGDRAGPMSAGGSRQAAAPAGWERSLEAACAGLPGAMAVPLIASMAPPGAVPAARIGNRRWLDAILRRFGVRYASAEPRAVASQWSKWYFAVLLRPALVANLLLDRELLASPHGLSLTMTLDHRPERLSLGHPGAPLDAFATPLRFSGLLRHLSPAVGALAAVSGASPRVFWSNAGNTFEHALTVLAGHSGARPAALDAARETLQRDRLPDGQRNPLYRPVDYRLRPDGRVQRCRRLCCIRYLLAELDYCAGCPLTCGRARRVHRAASGSGRGPG